MSKLSRLETAEDLEQAFEEWNVQIFRYVYARVGKQEVAEDLTQETFLKAWKKRTLFNPEKSALRTWFFTIAINTMRDYFRGEKHRKTVELEDSIVDETDIEGEHSSKEGVELVFDFVRQLPQRDQELLTLRYVDGLIIREIGDILKMEYNATKVAIHRAVKKQIGRAHV